MIKNELARKAVIFAYKTYLNRYDKNKIPEIFHIYKIAEQMNSVNGYCVSLLAKAVCDNKELLKHLKKEFPFEITDALFILLPDDTLSYPDYIRRIKTNKIAAEVKKAQLKYELSYSKNNKKIPSSQKERYVFALRILENENN